jgi:hypothetical protein
LNGRRARKVRMVRDGDVPDGSVVVLRAAPTDRERLLRNVMDDATDSAATYVVLRPDGSREVLFGISVIGLRPGRSVADVLSRFRSAPGYLRATVGAFRHAGFELWPTGANPDHYDVQLLPGHFEGFPQPTVDELREAATRMLATAGDVVSNPDYPGESEDER